MDRRGSGIQRILNSYKNYSQEPTFYSDESIFLVTMPNRSFTGAKRVQKIPPQYTAKVMLANKSKGQIAEKGSLTKEVSGQKVEKSALANKSKSQIAEKGSLTKEVGPQTDEKVALANKSKGQIAKKGSLTKEVVGQTDAKVTLANKSKGQTVEKGSLTKEVGLQTDEKVALANKSKGQTVEKGSLTKGVGPQTDEKSFSEYKIRAEDLPIRLDLPAVDNVIDAIVEICKQKNRQGAFRDRTLKQLADFYTKYKSDYSFNRDALAAFFNIGPDAATKIIRKCCDLGIMRREKRSVYFFINLD